MLRKLTDNFPPFNVSCENHPIPSFSLKYPILLISHGSNKAFFCKDVDFLAYLSKKLNKTFSLMLKLNLIWVQ